MRMRVRQRISGVYQGRAFDVVTNAHDLTQIDGIGDGLNEMEGMFRLLHTAALRLKVDGVPADFDTFVDGLDELATPDDDGKQAEADPDMNPTSAGRSAT